MGQAEERSRGGPGSVEAMVTGGPQKYGGERQPVVPAMEQPAPRKAHLFPFGLPADGERDEEMIEEHA